MEVKKFLNELNSVKIVIESLSIYLHKDFVNFVELYEELSPKYKASVNKNNIFKNKLKKKIIQEFIEGKDINKGVDILSKEIEFNYTFKEILDVVKYINKKEDILIFSNLEKFIIKKDGPNKLNIIINDYLMKSEKEEDLLNNLKDYKKNYLDNKKDKEIKEIEIIFLYNLIKLNNCNENKVCKKILKELNFSIGSLFKRSGVDIFFRELIKLIDVKDMNEKDKGVLKSEIIKETGLNFGKKTQLELKNGFNFISKLVEQDIKLDKIVLLFNLFDEELKSLYGNNKSGGELFIEEIFRSVKLNTQKGNESKNKLKIIYEKEMLSKLLIDESNNNVNKKVIKL